MAKFKVVAPVEHDQTLYVPKGAATPHHVRSVGNGQQIPANASGVVDLDERYAKPLLEAGVVLVSDDPEPRREPRKSRRQVIADGKS